MQFLKAATRRSSASAAQRVASEIVRVVLFSTVIWSVIDLLGAPRADLRAVLASSFGCAVLWSRPALSLLDRGSTGGRPVLRLVAASCSVQVMTAAQGIACLYPAFLLAMIVITMQDSPGRHIEAAIVVIAVFGTATTVFAIRTGLPWQVIPVPAATTIALAALGGSLFTVQSFAATGRVLARNAAALEASTRALAEEQRLRADEQTQRAEQLHYAANHDVLTGVLSRSGITTVLTESVPDCRPGSGVAVIYLDLDGFKSVNDAWGHGVGDALLVVVAERLLATVRPGDHVGRMGGDEFLLVLTDLINPRPAESVSDRVSRAIAEPIDVCGHRLAAGISAGLAYNDDPSAEPDTLIAVADAAMYACKLRSKVA